MAIKPTVKLLAIVPFIFYGFLGNVQAQKSAKRPNIILFMVDDMGWQDTSVPFWEKKTPLNERYRTPNMQRLANEGVKFTNAYATPVCTPTRISLLTGINAAHHKVTNWTNIQQNISTDAKDSTFKPVDWNINGLSPQAGFAHTVHATPLPQLLKEAGYFTIHTGKAHWGPMGMPGSSPRNLGFIVNIAGHAAGHPQNYYGQQNYGNVLGKATYHAVPDLEEYYGSEVFLSEAITREAIKAIAHPIETKQPFFLHLSHYAVHTPIQGDARFIEKYQKMGLDSTEAKYASLVEGMDKSLGDVMDYLKKVGQADNTIIIFMSDNGGLSQGNLRGGGAHTQNLPLKIGKGSVHEGGVRVPMLVKWPSVVKPSTEQNQYVIVEDFFPSILEMAGVISPKTIQKVDGKSFVPLLKNPALKDQNRSLVWHYPNKWGGTGAGINYASAIRKGDWKLLYDMKKQELSLYNIREDIGESNNQAAQFPQKVKELASELSQKLKGWNALMPAYAKDGSPVPWPEQVAHKN